MAIIRPAQPSDAPLLFEHHRRHGSESGRDGDPIFSPMDGPSDTPWEEFERTYQEKQGRALLEPGWERTWVVTDSRAIYGELTLAHQPPLKTCLHRATLMMGIERSHRHQGHGSQLMTIVIGWARAQPTLDWLQLYVFEGNEPARALYRRFGFQESGTIPDMFRVFGVQIADIAMTLRLR